MKGATLVIAVLIACAPSEPAGDKEAIGRSDPVLSEQQIEHVTLLVQELEIVLQSGTWCGTAAKRLEQEIDCFGRAGWRVASSMMSEASFKPYASRLQRDRLAFLPCVGGHAAQQALAADAAPRRR